VTSGACRRVGRPYSGSVCAAPFHETRHAPEDSLALHRHGCAYAALVIDGCHVEASVDGPMRCEPGTLLLHPRFHAHANRFGGAGARVLNLVLDDAVASEGARAYRVGHLGDARDVFAHGAARLLAALIDDATPTPRVEQDWRSAFLHALRETEAPVGRIARGLGLSSAYVSRALQRSHGMGPQALRRELRWRQALSLLCGDKSLAEVAALAGFADQSHFNRVARSCSGMTPAQLRRQVKSVQDAQWRPAA